MSTNVSKRLEVDDVHDLEPGDQLYSDLGGVYWVTSIGEKRWVITEDVNGEEEWFDHTVIEDGLEDGGWMLESRAPGGEGLEV